MRSARIVLVAALLMSVALVSVPTASAQPTYCFQNLSGYLCCIGPVPEGGGALGYVADTGNGGWLLACFVADQALGLGYDAVDFVRCVLNGTC